MAVCPPACLPPLNRLIIGRGRRAAGAPGHLPEVAIQGDALLGGMRAGEGQRHGQQGVGPQARFVGRAVQRNQRLIQRRL